MTAIWHFYWPILVVAAIIGIATGIASFRVTSTRKPSTFIAAGAVLAVALAFVWHGPGGAGRRFAMSIERSAQVALANYEMTQVTARLAGHPIRRTIILSGPANDFQQRQLVRILNEIPGVSRVRWDRPIAPSKGL